MKRARRLRLSGRVQGVGFRFSVRAAAVALEVSGWVKNLPDGRLEIHAEGPPEQLDSFAERIGAPSSYGEVGIESRDVPMEELSGFEIRR